MTGLTAFIGIDEICKPQEGETFVVSAAAGAVGSVAGQLAKARGARVVGIAGGPEKTALLSERLGFDATVDYKADDWHDQLKAATPNGIDMDFENVGGEIMDAVFARLNLRGRVALCGLISGYNENDPPAGPRAFGRLLVNRVLLKGFIVLDHFGRAPEAAAEIGGPDGRRQAPAARDGGGGLRAAAHGHQHAVRRRERGQARRQGRGLSRGSGSGGRPTRPRSTSPRARVRARAGSGSACTCRPCRAARRSTSITVPARSRRWRRPKRTEPSSESTERRRHGHPRPRQCTITRTPGVARTPSSRTRAPACVMTTLRRTTGNGRRSSGAIRIGRYTEATAPSRSTTRRPTRWRPVPSAIVAAMPDAVVERPVVVEVPGVRDDRPVEVQGRGGHRRSRVLAGVREVRPRRAVADGDRLLLRGRVAVHAER